MTCAFPSTKPPEPQDTGYFGQITGMDREAPASCEVEATRHEAVMLLYISLGLYQS